MAISARLIETPGFVQNVLSRFGLLENNVSTRRAGKPSKSFHLKEGRMTIFGLLVKSGFGIVEVK